MKALAIVLLLATSACGQQPMIATATPAETIQFEQDREAHPERWRGDAWFLLGPVGDASMRRYDAAYPNANRGKPDWKVQQERQVANYFKSVTGREFVPLHKRTVETYEDMLTPAERARFIADTNVTIAKRKDRESEIAELRAQLRVLLARLEALEK